MLVWTPHKMLPVPTDEEISVMEPEEVIEFHRIREEAIVNEAKDKYRFGFRFPNWEKVAEQLETHNEALVSGGNRSSKSVCGAYMVVRAAVENPNSRIFCFAQTAEVSVDIQQSVVYDWLPSEYKEKQTSSQTYINYSRKNGFTDNSFILPNGSQVFFKTYAAYQNNPSILEGAELGSHSPEWVNLGCWLDEYLGAPDIIETLRFRLATRNAKLLLTFTPIFGYTMTVSQYLKNAKPIERRAAELLDGEMIPTIMECENINGTVHFFWTEDNPYAGYGRIRETLKGKPRSEILIRAYGVPTKSYSTKFPKFSIDVNVLKRDQMRKFTHGETNEKGEFVPAKVTRRQIIDPAGKKSWFMGWIAVDATGTYYIYREWPGVDVGDWAEQGKDGKWKPGEGAKPNGFGLKNYIETIFTEEGAATAACEWKSANDWSGGEEIFERLIDPRLGAAKYQGADGESSIMQDLDDLDFVAMPAPGDNIEDGIQKINDLLAYDTTKPIDGMNRPRLYISEDCQNIINAFGEYTGDDGQKEAWKDPIDIVRYAAAAEIDHVDNKLMIVTQTAGGY